MFAVADKDFLAELRITKDISDYPEGIIIPVNKPYRWTSADVIRKVKYLACRHFGKKNLKVGHAGTLDPLATGVLLVCIGAATRQAETLQKHDKEYIAGLTFGATTASYDLEKEIDSYFPYEHITEEGIREILPRYIGEQEQVAPLFSAKSVDGVRAYELARKLYKESLKNNTEHKLDSNASELLSRQKITISELELTDFFPAGSNHLYDLQKTMVSEDNAKNSRINVIDISALKLPSANIRVACSKGTYIRALARDLGEALGSGAHLNYLCRSRSGDFSVDKSLEISDIENLLK